MIKGMMKLIKGIFSIGLTLGLIGIAIYIDARYIEPKLLWEKEETLQTSKLSHTTKLKVVLFSDVHLGESYSLSDFDKVIDKINALKPDMILFAGDLIDDYKEFEADDKVGLLLQKLKAPYGKYTIYGNHDHGGYGTERYAKIMKTAGFTLLRNQNATIELAD